MNNRVSPLINTNNQGVVTTQPRKFSVASLPEYETVNPKYEILEGQLTVYGNLTPKQLEQIENLFNQAVPDLSIKSTERVVDETSNKCINIKTIIKFANDNPRSALAIMTLFSIFPGIGLLLGGLRTAGIVTVASGVAFSVVGFGCMLSAKEEINANANQQNRNEAELSIVSPIYEINLQNVKLEDLEKVMKTELAKGANMGHNDFHIKMNGFSFELRTEKAIQVLPTYSETQQVSRIKPPVRQQGETPPYHRQNAVSGFELPS